MPSGTTEQSAIEAAVLAAVGSYEKPRRGRICELGKQLDADDPGFAEHVGLTGEKLALGLHERHPGPSFGCTWEELVDSLRDAGVDASIGDPRAVLVTYLKRLHPRPTDDEIDAALGGMVRYDPPGGEVAEVLDALLGAGRLRLELAEVPDLLDPRHLHTVCVIRLGPKESDAETAIPPLTDAQRAAWNILCALPQGHGLIGKDLCKELDRQGHSTDQPTLTTRIIPTLKKLGLKNKGGVGYFIPSGKHLPL